MFNIWAYSVLIAAAIAAVFSYKVPRAWYWIGALVIDFIATSLYWDFGNRSYHPIFTLACDAMVCLVVYQYAKEKWEAGVFLAFLASVFVSLFRIGLLIPDSVSYASGLETCNYIALIIIAGMGIMDAISVRKGNVFSDLSRSLHSTRHSIF